MSTAADITSLTAALEAAKKAYKAQKDDKKLKKAFKKAKKALEEAEAAAKAAAEAAKDESSDSSSSSSGEEEEEESGPTLEELQSAMKAAKKAWKANKEDKSLKKAFKAAKAAVAEKESASAESTPVNKKRKRDDAGDESPAKKAKAAEDSDVKVVNNSKPTNIPPGANEKLFLGNLSFDVDDNTIKDFFKDCGQLVDIFWLKDRDTGNFKGCGFVTFDSVEGACKAVELNGEDLMGREIRIDFAKPRPGGDKPRTPRTKREARPLSSKPEGCLTVFCGNLSFDIDDAKMQDFASQAGCGQIAHIRWLTDRDTGDFKGCGFVEFGDTGDVDKFVKMNGSNCMGRDIRCDYAKPRAPREY